jgi:hypothetical protein
VPDFTTEERRYLRKHGLGCVLWRDAAGLNDFTFPDTVDDAGP